MLAGQLERLLGSYNACRAARMFTGQPKCLLSSQYACQAVRMAARQSYCVPDSQNVGQAAGMLAVGWKWPGSGLAKRESAREPPDRHFGDPQNLVVFLIIPGSKGAPPADGTGPSVP